jgi:hypothetical protein
MEDGGGLTTQPASDSFFFISRAVSSNKHLSGSAKMAPFRLIAAATCIPSVVLTQPKQPSS